MTAMASPWTTLIISLQVIFILSVPSITAWRWDSNSKMLPSADKDPHNEEVAHTHSKSTLPIKRCLLI